MNPSINFLIFFLLPISSIAQSQPSISVSNKTLPKSGDPLTIHWSGLDSPNKLDWVGIYAPPNSSHDNFIGYLFLSTSPTWESGAGSITLPLINLRSNYQFRIFKWNESEIDPTHQDQDHNPLPGTNHLLAESEEVGFESGSGPEQVHLALTGREREMRVMFTHDGEESYVRYGLREDSLDRVVDTIMSWYEREDLCHGPANESIGWRDPGVVYDGVMTHLKPGKKYYYQVGSDFGGWSDTFNFVSQDEDSSQTIAFLFGDMGTATPYNTFLRTQQESISTVKWIKRDLEDLGDDKPAFISHIGDLSYARGYSWLWDNFFNQIEPIASKVPYHVCIGNHEYDWPSQPWRPNWSTGIYGTDGGGECGVPYSYKFNMPGNSSEKTTTRALTKNLYYSLDVGVVHFVYISTETNFLQGSDQYKFIKNDLESVNRKKTPFVVVQGHRPMYTSSLDIKGIPLRKKMIEHLEPLLVKNKVNLVLWGHVHRYERFCPMNNSFCGSLSSGLPVHIVIGMGGQDWQKIWEPRSDHPNDPVFPQPASSLYRSGELGYTRLFATKKKLTFAYVGNHDGEVHDVVNILRSGEVVYDNSGWREMIASS